VSDHAGSAEVVQDSVNGFVVRRARRHALAARLALLLGDAALGGAWARRRARPRRRGRETYGDERHDRIYAPLLGQPLREDAHAASSVSAP
jgi:hypothetical protein